MKKTVLIAILVIFVGLPAYAVADSREMCRKFYRKTNLGKCISMQEAARKRLKSGEYYPEIAKKCIEQSRRKDRLASYTDWRKADKCAKKEQRRVLEDAALKAQKEHAEAAAEYLREAAETERQLRNKK